MDAFTFFVMSRNKENHGSDPDSDYTKDTAVDGNSNLSKPSCSDNSGK